MLSGKRRQEQAQARAVIEEFGEWSPHGLEPRGIPPMRVEKIS